MGEKMRVFIFKKRQWQSALLIIALFCAGLAWAGFKCAGDEPVRVMLEDPLREGKIAVSLARYLKLIRHLKPYPAAPGGNRDVVWRYCLRFIKRNGTELVHYLTDGGLIIDPARRCAWTAPEPYRRMIARDIARLAKTGVYGEFLPWSEVRWIFRRYDLAKVIDFETRKTFWVQRRAGSSHADAQPLTFLDTRIMKDIYGGEWSWRRRAIIVEAGGRHIAASMNGMPHGAGALVNGFPGHFCIHFRDSSTHSGHLALSHQMMIWKAAGLRAKIAGFAPPDVVAALFCVALDEKEYGFAGRLTSAGSKWPHYLNKLCRFSRVRFISLIPDASGRESRGFLVKLYLGYGRDLKIRTVRMDMRRRKGRWLLSEDTLENLTG